MIIHGVKNNQEFVNWENTDYDLLKLKKSHFFWKWPIFNDLFNLLDTTLNRIVHDNYTDGAIVIIRGPRQVGKSALIKTLAKELHRTAVRASTYFLQGDLIFDFKELYALILQCVKEKLSLSPLIFIDEITFIHEWQRAIKAVTDAGESQGAIFIITGSNALDLKNCAELFPGRRGTGQDYSLLPMNFAEFTASCRHTGLYQAKELSPTALFRLYCQIGGFPHALNEHLDSGTTEGARRVYLSWIKGDVLKAKKNDELLRELMAALAKTGTSAVGIDALKKKTSLGSHNTLSDYLDFMHRTFIATELRHVTPGIWTLHPRKNRKYYFRDPLIHHLAHEWSGLSEQDQGYLYEAVVAEHLIRRYHGRIGYFRTSQDQEIDFYAPDFAIEVKTARKISSDDLRGLQQVSSPQKMLVYGGDRETKFGEIRIRPIWEFCLEPAI